MGKCRHREKYLLSATIKKTKPELTLARDNAKTFFIKKSFEIVNFCLQNLFKKSLENSKLFL